MFLFDSQFGKRRWSHIRICHSAQLYYHGCHFADGTGPPTFLRKSSASKYIKLFLTNSTCDCHHTHTGKIIAPTIAGKIKNFLPQEKSREFPPPISAFPRTWHSAGHLWIPRLIPVFFSGKSSNHIPLRARFHTQIRQSKFQTSSAPTSQISRLFRSRITKTQNSGPFATCGNDERQTEMQQKLGMYRIFASYSLWCQIVLQIADSYSNE